MRTFFQTDAQEQNIVRLWCSNSNTRIHVASGNNNPHGSLDIRDAAMLKIIHGPNNVFVIMDKTRKYWFANANGNLTFIDDHMEATVFVAEHCEIDTYLQDLNIKGYTILKNLVDADVCDKMKQTLDLPSELSLDEIQVRRGDLLKRDPIFASALLHSEVLEVLRHYLHPHMKCATWSSNTLYPNHHSSEDYHWHVDYPYHDMTAPWSITPMSAQVVWCLDDFQQDNGATHIIEGGHRQGTFPTSTNIQNMKRTTLIAPKGSIVIAHGAWWHSQGINKTTKTRTCLLGTFVQPWIKPKDNMHEMLPKDFPQTKELEDIIL